MSSVTSIEAGTPSLRRLHLTAESELARVLGQVGVTFEHHHRCRGLVVQRPGVAPHCPAIGAREPRGRGLLPPCSQHQPPGDGHDDDHIVQGHPRHVHQVHCEDLVTHYDAARAVDGGLEGDPGDKHPVCPVHAITLPDVETQRLAGPLDNFNKTCARVRILERNNLSLFVKI